MDNSNCMAKWSIPNLPVYNGSFNCYQSVPILTFYLPFLFLFKLFSNNFWYHIALSLNISECISTRVGDGLWIRALLSDVLWKHTVWKGCGYQWGNLSNNILSLVHIGKMLTVCILVGCSEKCTSRFSIKCVFSW